MRRLAPLLLLVLASPALARPVRVFVVNPHLRMPASYADFREQMFALVDAAHPRRAELVQQGVPDIAAHLSPRDPSAPVDALIVFPEDVGLVAGLIGSRGATARQITAATGGSTVAFLSLTLAYQPLVRYYGDRYPGLPGLAYLFLATTDTHYRAVYETFRDLAATYGVYVAASVNVAPARRVEAAADPALVARLRDPDEPDRGYAYEAIEGRPVNTMFLFAPDGSVLVHDRGVTRRAPGETAGVLRGSLDKAYLTEIEQDPLGLSLGAVRDLDVLDTPFGRLGAVTSKDAWMVDVNDRYDAKGAQLILQPEAFDQWAFTTDFWAPDGFKAGGFAQVQRNPSFLYNATSCLVGNLFDITFDGQGAVIGKRHKPVRSEQSAALAWIGQDPDAGFVAVAPWVAADPGGPDLAARRAALVAAGLPLLPSSGVPCIPPLGPGSCEDGYRESIQRVDVDLPAAGAAPPPRQPGAPVPTAFGTASFIAAASAEQRHPRLAADGDHVFVVWQERRADVDRIYLAVSDDGGATFTTRRASDAPDGAAAEWRPAVAFSPRTQTVHVVWQEPCAAADDDCGRILSARFDTAGRKQGGDVRVDRGADDAGKWNAALAVDRAGNPLVAWVDERDRSDRGLPLEHIYFARSRDGGATFGRNLRVDRGRPVDVAAELDNKWAPAIAVRPPFIQIAWTDFRDYQWDIYTTRSRDGRYFEPNVRVDDGASERIHDHPAIAVDRRGTVHVAWADRQRQDPDTDIRYTRSPAGGRRFAASTRIDAGVAAANQWHPALAVDGDDVLIAWQDNRLGDNDVFFARSRDRGGTFAGDQRLDDSGGDPSEQTRPDLAIDAVTHTAYAAWEDERWGPSRIALAKTPLR
ncbi:hypothetical protein KF840_07780 [bacterium]|nr:hypothetical protein [bacterium]